MLFMFNSFMFNLFLNVTRNYVPKHAIYLIHEICCMCATNNARRLIDEQAKRFNN